LQNVDERIRPAVWVAQWPQQKMHVIGHDNDGMKKNSRYAHEGQNAALA
jgi:hypothetical protein